jgi:hypothetical protein
MDFRRGSGAGGRLMEKKLAMKVERIMKLLTDGYVPAHITRTESISKDYLSGMSDLMDYLFEECPEGGCLVKFNTYGEMIPEAQEPE